MKNYDDYIDSIYMWVKEISGFGDAVVPANQKLDEKYEEFISIECGDIIPNGTLKSQNKKNIDGEIYHSIKFRYKQTIEVEIYSEDAENKALQLEQSLQISSKKTHLKGIYIKQTANRNTTISIDGEYETRRLLSLLVYFTLDSQSNPCEPVESIKVTGKVKGYIDG